VEMKNRSDIACAIIENNLYMSLASTNGDECWVSPLYYVIDNKFNFYFVSNVNSVHAQNIIKNERVAVTIFNSRLKPEDVNGVQFDGICKVLSIRELPKAIKLLYSKKTSDLLKLRFNNYLNPFSYLKLTYFRIFKIIPCKVYVLDPDIYEDDVRIEVNLNDKC